MRTEKETWQYRLVAWTIIVLICLGFLAIDVLTTALHALALKWVFTP